MISVLYTGNEAECAGVIKRLTTKKRGHAEIDILPATEKIAVFDAIGAAILRHKQSSQLLIILDELGDLTQDCGLHRLQLLTENEKLVHSIILIIQQWKSIIEKIIFEDRLSFEWHKCYHSAIYIVMAMISSSDLCKAFATSLNQSDDFDNLCLLPTLLQNEIQYTTQQMVMEIICRMHIYYKRKDANKLQIFESYFPLYLKEKITNPTIGPGNILKNIRSFLNDLNTKNPNIVSLPLADIYYIMSWRAASLKSRTNRNKSSNNTNQILEKKLGHVSWLDIGKEMMTIQVDSPNSKEAADTEENEEGDTAMMSLKYCDMKNIHFAESEASIQLSIDYNTDPIRMFLKSEEVPPAGEHTYLRINLSGGLPDLDRAHAMVNENLKVLGNTEHLVQGAKCSVVSTQALTPFDLKMALELENQDMRQRLATSSAIPTVTKSEANTNKTVDIAATSAATTSSSTAVKSKPATSAIAAAVLGDGAPKVEKAVDGRNADTRAAAAAAAATARSRVGRGSALLQHLSGKATDKSRKTEERTKASLPPPPDSVVECVGKEPNNPEVVDAQRTIETTTTIQQKQRVSPELSRKQESLAAVRGNNQQQRQKQKEAQQTDQQQYQQQDQQQQQPTSRKSTRISPVSLASVDNITNSNRKRATEISPKLIQKTSKKEIIKEKIPHGRRNTENPFEHTEPPSKILLNITAKNKSKKTAPSKNTAAAIGAKKDLKDVDLSNIYDYQEEEEQPMKPSSTREMPPGKITTPYKSTAASSSTITEVQNKQAPNKKESLIPAQDIPSSSSWTYNVSQTQEQLLPAAEGLFDAIPQTYGKKGDIPKPVSPSTFLSSKVPLIQEAASKTITDKIQPNVLNHKKTTQLTKDILEEEEETTKKRMKGQNEKILIKEKDREKEVRDIKKGFSPKKTVPNKVQPDARTAKEWKQQDEQQLPQARQATKNLQQELHISKQANQRVEKYEYHKERQQDKENRVNAADIPKRKKPTTRYQTEEHFGGSTSNKKDVQKGQTATEKIWDSVNAASDADANIVEEYREEMSFFTQMSQKSESPTVKKKPKVEEEVNVLSNNWKEKKASAKEDKENIIKKQPYPPPAPAPAASKEASKRTFGKELHENHSSELRHQPKRTSSIVPSSARLELITRKHSIVSPQPSPEKRAAATTTARDMRDRKSEETVVVGTVRRPAQRGPVPRPVTRKRSEADVDVEYENDVITSPEETAVSKLKRVNSLRQTKDRTTTTATAATAKGRPVAEFSEEEMAASPSSSPEPEPEPEPTPNSVMSALDSSGISLDYHEEKGKKPTTATAVSTKRKIREDEHNYRTRREISDDEEEDEEEDDDQDVFSILFAEMLEMAKNREAKRRRRTSTNLVNITKHQITTYLDDWKNIVEQTNVAFEKDIRLKIENKLAASHLFCENLNTDIIKFQEEDKETDELLHAIDKEIQQLKAAVDSSNRENSREEALIRAGFATRKKRLLEETSRSVHAASKKQRGGGGFGVTKEQSKMMLDALKEL